MKWNYTNILLFSLSLKILSSSSEVYNQRNHILILHKLTTTSRLLCECELYAPANYDNDPEMKSVMQDFDRQTSQRLREYDERMIKNRQKCKDQCDKDIQKIILKDKIENELKERLDMLETNITTKDLPICECEKSLSHKMENTCLGCGGVLGSGIAPSVGLLGTVVVNEWTKDATATAIAAAKQTGALVGEAAGHVEGAKTVIAGLKTLGVDTLGSGPLGSFIDATNYMNETLIFRAVQFQHKMTCTLGVSGADLSKPICNNVTTFANVSGVVTENGFSTEESIKIAVKGIVSNGQRVAAIKAKDVTVSETAILKLKNIAEVQVGFESSITSISASIIAILIIILIMIIIYLILRYRRKKKMKKKLQYIKLLKE